MLHNGLLSSFLLCMLLLIVNLRSYVTDIQLNHPCCRVTEFSCAIFKDRVPSPSTEVVTCMRKCVGLKGRTWLTTVLSEQSELVRGLNLMKYSAHYSQADSQENAYCVFIVSLFYQPFFVNPRKTQSTALILQRSPTSHSYSQNSVVCYHW